MGLLCFTFLFGLQGQFDKVLLQLLVYVVDAELFKPVLSKDLKPVDIQDANNRFERHLVLPKTQIDLVYYPIKHPVVYFSRQRVPRTRGLLGVLGHIVRGSTVSLPGTSRVYDTEEHRVGEHEGVDAKIGRDELEEFGVGGLGPFAVGPEVEVAEMEDGRDELDETHLLGLGDTHGVHCLLRRGRATGR